MNNDLTDYYKHKVEMSEQLLSDSKKKQLRNYIINYFSHIDENLDNKYTDSNPSYADSIEQDSNDELSDLIQHIADSQDSD